MIKFVMGLVLFVWTFAHFAGAVKARLDGALSAATVAAGAER